MNLEDYTLVELRQMAKEQDVKNVSKLKKDELIELLSHTDNLTYYNDNENRNINNQSAYKITNDEDEIVEGILEVLPDVYGFLRCENYLSTQKAVYVTPVQIRRFKLDKGDKIKGIARLPKEGEKFPALIYVGEVNGKRTRRTPPAGGAFGAGSGKI